MTSFPIVFQTTGTGLAARFVPGLLGYIGRDWTPEDGFEDFELAKLVRTPLSRYQDIAHVGGIVFGGLAAYGLWGRMQRQEGIINRR